MPKPELKPGQHPLLTWSETQVMRLMIEGHTSKTAAAELKISAYTVQAHLSSIRYALNVHNLHHACAIFAVWDALREREQ